MRFFVPIICFILLSFIAQAAETKSAADTSGGVGFLLPIDENEGFRVDYLFAGLPAARAGLKQGDEVISIDGHPTKGMLRQEAINKMRGAPETSVLVGVKRDGVEKPLILKIIRKKFCDTSDCNRYTLLRPFAEAGDAEAQYRMTESEIVSGLDDGQDKLKWLRKAAVQGHLKAQESLCTSLTNIYVREYEEGYKWCWQAASQGSEKAQTTVSFLYREGLGVLPDAEAAYFWLCLAKRNAGHQSTCKDTKDNLSPEQKARIDKMIDAWKPRHVKGLVQPLTGGKY